MGRLLALALFALTLVLVAIAWLQSGGIAREQMRAAQTPEQAVRLLLTNAQAHRWDDAYSRLSNAADVDTAAFIRDFDGSNGSLLTYANIESFDVWGLHADDHRAEMRAKIRYSTALGPID